MDFFKNIQATSRRGQLGGFVYYIWVSSYPSTRDCTVLSKVCVLGNFVKNECELVSETSVFHIGAWVGCLNIAIVLFLVIKTCCLEISIVLPSVLFFLFKIALSLWEQLCLYINFVILFLVL